MDYIAMKNRATAMKINIEANPSLIKKKRLLEICIPLITMILNDTTAYKDGSKEDVYYTEQLDLADDFILVFNAMTKRYLEFSQGVSVGGTGVI